VVEPGLALDDNGMHRKLVPGLKREKDTPPP